MEEWLERDERREENADLEVGELGQNDANLSLPGWLVAMDLWTRDSVFSDVGV